jgi:hypothetical protein
MNLDDVIATLHPAAILAKAGTAVVAVYQWLKGRQQRGVDPDLSAALAKLPSTASADEIFKVVIPFMNLAGGNVALAAGNDGGGNVNATGVVMEGGSGTSKGGDVTINAGDGGPNGKGGDFTIVGGTIKGGDATRV